MKSGRSIPKDHKIVDHEDKSLRILAETRIAAKNELLPLPDTTEEMQRLIHELQVHQIELEIQNEELIQARAEIEDGLQRYTELYDFAPVGYFKLDNDGTILKINLTGAVLLGKERSLLTSRKFHGFVSATFLTAFNKFLYEVFHQKDETPLCLDISLRGEPLTFVHLTAHVAGPDNVCLMTMTDISKLKAAEEELKESETRYRSLFEKANEGIIFADPETMKIVHVNPAICRMLGYSKEELTVMNITDIHPKETLDQIFMEFKELAANDGGFLKSVPCLRKNGTTLIADITCSMVKMHEKEYLSGFFTDVTERIKAEEALNESEDRFRELFNSMSSGVAIYRALDNGEDFQFVDFNHGAEVIDNIKKEDAIGRRVGKVFPGVSEYGLLEVFRRVWQTGMAEHYPLFFYRDERISGWRDNYVYRLPSGEIVAIYNDVTEQKRAEEALKTSEKKYRDLVENISDVIFTMDLEGIITYISPVIEKLYGYTPEDVIGRKFLQFVHPDDLSMTIKAFQHRIEGEYGENMLRVIARDGTERSVRTTQKPIIHEGRVTGFNYIMTDFTERRKAEEALSMANNKLNMLSSITRHDILNMIMVIRGYLEMSEDIEKDPFIQEYMAKVNEAVDAIQHQIEFTRYYQDIGIEKPRWQNAGKLFSQTAESIDTGKIKVENQVSGVEVFSDPLIEKVFYNLIENSLRHGETVSVISLSCSKSGTDIIISYRDDGVGISEKDREMLFKKGYGRHTGLGLFLSREILSITGISISENGKEGEGVNFEITVPKGSYRFARDKPA